ncbi:MAG: hypothetical protein KKB31_05635 [Nanoarchaeota archaeon]|nr:hypothetical protein [Nanoarchaeota archaeon]
MKNELIFLGIIAITAYWVFPPWRNLINKIFRFRKDVGERGYYPNYIYPEATGIDAIPLPNIQFPDGGIETLKNCLLTKTGEGYVLETDERDGVIIKSIVEGVNIDYGDKMALAFGSGMLCCNIDFTGKEHKGWHGIGNPVASSQHEMIKILKNENSNLRNMIDKMQKQVKAEQLRNADLIGQLTRRRGKKSTEEEEEEKKD